VFNISLRGASLAQRPRPLLHVVFRDCKCLAKTMACASHTGVSRPSQALQYKVHGLVLARKRVGVVL